MAAWARWCLKHRIAVLLLWLAALFGTVAAAVTAGTAYSNVFKIPGTGSSAAFERMEKAFPDQAGDVDTIVWENERGDVRDPAVRERITALLADVARMPDVGKVVSPYDPAGATQISDNHRIAYAQITFVKQQFELDKANTKRLIDRAEKARAPGLRVELGGPAIADAQNPPAGLAETVGIVAAGVILFFAFGSLFAMLLPLVSGIFAVGTGLATAVLLSHVTGIPEVATLLGSLIGLGVGIDYALFIVTRHRNGLKAGLTPEEAAVRALDTSGRAVLFAGGTVCAALLTLFTVDISLLDGIAIATTLVVVLSVLAASTLLPALLGFLGTRTLSRRERRALADSGPQSGGTSDAGRGAIRYAAFVERHPRALGAVALAVMAALAIPVFSLRLGANDQGNQRTSQTVRQAYDLLAEGFGPGFNGPLMMVAELNGPQDAQAFDTLVDHVRHTPGVVRADVLPLPAEGGLAAATRVVQVVPTTSPQAEATDDLIDRLRDRTVPDAARGTTLKVHIGGETAMQKDFAAVVGDRLPGFVALIVGLGALLMLLAFRSVLVPLTAAVMNLIAAAASFGVLVAIFQWGWGMDLLGLGKEGPIVSFLPVIMLPLLFGLSMDYQVFLVSRMHEEWLHTRDNARAVRMGQAGTGRVINSAALIMIFVFSSFILTGDREGMMAGIGLAGAVALDAFILRMLLVPATMHLLGRANWWLPAWLDKLLPHLAVDPPDRPVTPVLADDHPSDQPKAMVR
ncbi:MMPL family transporter [Yinghuangia seranimata]|uniref:MMPL family transporter n=1 Tax=Yinghuangia seranimata TaxID=408067 RepID=UPI00248B0C71|nr:MMPL family transporter [Yinghuangia seranimata]MDI2124715.1 MMPL family transporter [Yinghuangia seranimata]